MMGKSILMDGFSRNHTYLRISLTEKCNLRCTYCMPADGVLLSPKSELMTTDEIIKIAKVFINHGVTKIRLTGGEPLIRKDFADIISQLSKLNIEITLTTNGILIDKYIEVLKENRIKNINFSLDTLNTSKFQTITLKNQFEKVKNNLELLLNEDFNVKLNVVLIKKFNDNEIIDFIKLTEKSTISVRFIEFMPFDGNDWNKSKLVSQAEILNTVTNYFSDSNVVKLENENNFIARNYQIKGFLGQFGIISSITNPFCDGCNRIRLTANGKLKNCLFSNLETDLLTTLRSGNSIENIIEKTVQSKLQKRAGMNTDADINNPKLHFKNRSMIAIGG